MVEFLQGPTLKTSRRPRRRYAEAQVRLPDGRVKWVTLYLAQDDNGENARTQIELGVMYWAEHPEERTMGESMVERVARALCVADGRDPDGPTNDVYVPGDPDAIFPWAGYRRQARAAIAATLTPQEAARIAMLLEREAKDVADVRLARMIEEAFRS